MPSARERILFVTGRLAEPLVRRVAAEVAGRVEFDFDVEVVGISVAALLHAEWLSRKLSIDGPFDRVILPGWCQGDLAPLAARFCIPFERGPKDVLDLPAHFGLGGTRSVDLSRFDIEIIAEINHAPQMSDAQILALSKDYRDSGADVIDVGCIPGESWPRIRNAVAMLRAEGFRVSVDSFDQKEVTAAVEAGAELVLSVNQSNLDWAVQLPVEWVAIPDTPSSTEQLIPITERLSEAGRTFRVDPIIEPIGFGFATSLARYFEVRRERADWAMMMGVGNITEMSEVDSAGLNFLLAAVCQELSIGSVLTTEVANWARSSVKEFDLARRLVKQALDERRLVKKVDSPLLVVRDDKLRPQGEEFLEAMSRQLKDPNFRIFVERGRIHVMNRDGYWQGNDPFELFDSFSKATTLDASHAFYLGYELCKAVTALKLDKQYTQDQALRWGFLSWSELSAHERRREERTKS
ncbi:dihydropteroate synthase [Planctomyces sp. SCGC AG-212-M04]|nr:dihydropteroate synthase [Planctomyces sp. SCGC AG-212-M04]